MKNNTNILKPLHKGVKLLISLILFTYPAMFTVIPFIIEEHYVGLPQISKLYISLIIGLLVTLNIVWAGKIKNKKILLIAPVALFIIELILSMFTVWPPTPIG